MNAMDEIKQALGKLSPRERTGIAMWLSESGDGGYTVAEPAVAYGAAQEPHRLSVEEYLKFEEASPAKHEYVAGEIFAMSGPSLRHNVISQNVARAFSDHLRGGPCQSFIADIKVRLKIDTKEFFYYPDVVVACGQLNMEERYLLNPKLIVEVLSPATESIDRREKALNYQRIASLEEYVLVAQRMQELTFYRRVEDWEPRALTAPEAVAQFQSIELALPLARIYEGIR
jgi:Uma2 family endonuclease